MKTFFGRSAWCLLILWCIFFTVVSCDRFIDLDDNVIYNLNFCDRDLNPPSDHLFFRRYYPKHEKFWIILEHFTYNESETPNYIDIYSNKDTALIGVFNSCQLVTTFLMSKKEFRDLIYNRTGNNSNSLFRWR